MEFERDRTAMLDLNGFQGLDEEIIVDTSDCGLRYLLISPNGSHTKLAPGAYHLIKGVHTGLSFEALAREFGEKGGHAVSVADIETAYRDVAQQFSNIIRRESEQNLPTGFWLRFKLLPAGVVARVAAVLSILFHPIPALFLLSFVVIAFGVMLTDGLAINSIGNSLWLGYLLFIISLLAHELGHASACSRFGSNPSDIGFAFYLIYPAFYSDVTEAWRLKRWQRAVVDLGGTFFQAVVGGIFAIGYIYSGWDSLRLACLMICYGALFSLNPIFKYDGYWLLSDALGVTNLSKQPAIFAKHLYARLSGKHLAPLPWPRWLITVLSVYTPLTFFVWAYFVWNILPFLALQTINYPQALVSIWKTFFEQGWSSSLKDEVLMFSATSFVLAFIWYGLWNLLRGTVIARARLWVQQGRIRRTGVREPANVV